jgi:phospholipase A1
MPRAVRAQRLFLLLLLPLSVSLVPVCAFADEGEVDFQIIATGTGLTLHKEMFTLPYTYSDEYRGKNTEAVFQLSAKHRLFGTGFYMAFTQISFWQAYDIKGSAPFRDTNYNPEFFYRFKPRARGSDRWGADAGFEHESNGQRVPLSRSWNLLYLAPWYQRGNVLLYVKGRYRLPEDPKPSPDVAEGDDNPDITNYLGYSDAHLYYRFAGTHQIHLAMRGVIGSGGRGNVSLGYTFPAPRGEGSHIFLRLSHGYGESMMDYRKRISRVGIGVAFNR